MSAAAQDFRWPPRLSLDAASPPATLVAFDTFAPCTGRVRFGWPAAEQAERTPLARTVSDAGGTTHHVLRLADLPPDTPVAYRAEADDGAASPVRVFRTPPAPGAGVSSKFVFHGDMQGGLATPSRVVFPYIEDLVRTMRAERPLAVFQVGDMADEAYRTHGTGAEAWNDFFRLCRDEIAETYFLPALGNHDCPPVPAEANEPEPLHFDRRAGLFHGMFALPEPLGPREAAYALDVGPVRLVVLNTEADIASQNGFLARELQRGAFDPACRALVLMEHRPPFSSVHYGGNEEVKENWLPIFKRYEGTLVLSGHVHAYQRFAPFAPEGPVCLVTGGSGGYLFDEPSEAADRPDFATTCYHCVAAEVGKKAMSCRAVRSDGLVFDRFEIPLARHVRVSPVFPEAGGTATVHFTLPEDAAEETGMRLLWEVDGGGKTRMRRMERRGARRFAARISIPENARKKISFRFAADSGRLFDNASFGWQALLAD
jgi:hypothetical protein